MNVLIVALVALTQLSGKVVSIADGDTLTVRTADKTVKVRLVHIDAPESGQPFGSRSKQNLSDLTFGKTVDLIGTEKDRYGRLLAVVKVDGLEVNLEQVKAGLAWAFIEYKPPLNYVEAEKRARAARAGLWSDRQPVAPWDYRKQSRAKRKKAG
jgi:micrococcal nuclease